MAYTIAIQGIAGSYSDSAVDTMLGEPTERVPFKDFASTLGAVASGEVDLAVVPTYNSIIGEVGGVNGLIEELGLRKVKISTVRIDHVLVGPPGSNFEGLSEIISHREALRQCDRFLKGHPQLLALEDHDTASAVRRTVEAGKRNRAAIGSRKAAAIYGGEILIEDVADSPNNTTTFCLVKK